MAETTTDRTLFAETFSRIVSESRGHEPTKLVELRGEAFGRFEKAGIPGPRDEAWRNTPIAAVGRTPFGRPGPSVPGGLSRLERGDGLLSGNPTIWLVNGRVVPSSAAASPGAGVWIGTLGEAIAAGRDEVEAIGTVGPRDGHPFADLNTASFEDAVLVIVEGGAHVEEPIRIVHRSHPDASPLASHPRLLIVARPGSRSAVVESYVGRGGIPYLANAVTELVLDEDARLDHYRVQAESPEAFHLGALHVRQDRGSRLISHNVSIGAGLSRVDLVSVLAGSGAECEMNGLYLVDGDRHADSHTVIDHSAARASSRETYKGILGGRSRAVFNGRIVVRPGAQQTDARQSNRNLLLSEEALVFARPQLEIRADDVKCTHGATVGQLDADALFYLRSRGLGSDGARRVLIRAFANEMFGRMSLAAVRERLETELDRRIPEIGP